MSLETTQRRRPPVVRALIGTALVGCSLLAAPGVAQADPLVTRPSVDGAATARPTATPLQLVSATRTGPEAVDLVLRGAPGDRYDVFLLGRADTASGTVPEDGLVRWTVAEQRASFAVVAQSSDEAGQETVHLHVDAPALPGPVVAQPGAGDVDPGFAVQPDAPEPTDPVVAEPGIGDVDPGFTLGPGRGDGGEEAQQPGEVTLVGTAPGHIRTWTAVTVAATPGDEFFASAPDGSALADGERVPADGRVTFEVPDLLVGESTTLDVRTVRDGRERHGRLEVAGAGQEPEPTWPGDLDAPVAPGEGVVVDPGFTPPTEQAPVGTLQVEHLRTLPAGSAVFRLTDATATGTYDVKVRIDGTVRGFASVSAEGEVWVAANLPVGHHTIDFEKGHDVVGTIGITI